MKIFPEETLKKYFDELRAEIIQARDAGYIGMTNKKASHQLDLIRRIKNNLGLWG